MLGIVTCVLVCAVSAVADEAEAVARTAAWAERVFSQRPNGRGGNRLVIAHDDEPGTAKIGLCAAGTPLRLGERTYSRGIGVNSRCTIAVSLSGPAKRLLADIGIDRNVDNTPASTQFVVRVAGADVFATDVMKPTGEARSIDVPLSGATAFDLVVEDGGDGRSFDQADWADARVELEDGSMLWLDDLATASGVGDDVPFSFVYGARSSREFLHEWKQEVADEAIDATRRRLTATWTDPETSLEVQAVCDVYLDTAGVDWTLSFANTGTADTPILEHVRAADVSLWPGPGVVPAFHSLRASSGVDDWMPFSQPLPPGQPLAFSPTRGRSSCGACPFFNVSWANEGVITAIGWTGQWQASVEYTGGSLRIQGGMQNLRLSLKPGERIRSPRILQLFWREGDDQQPYNLFRQTMFAHIMPKVAGECPVPPIAHLSTSFYEMDDGTEADVLSHLDSARDMGFEFFWLDAYYGPDRFPTVGNYVLPLVRAVDPKRFPRGLRPISDATHEAGMKFLLWMEPERICPGTLMAKEHPEWVVMPEGGGWGMLNLGNPEAREYLTQYLLQAVAEYRIDCLRIDNATDFDRMWRVLNGNTEDRVGMAEIRYVEGLYQVWDTVLAANPNLFIDNVSSGGHRIDLETASRSINLWRTDATIQPLMEKNYEQAALQNQVMTAGLSRFVPFTVSGQSGATPYLFRSGFNAGISFCEDIRPQEYPRELLKEAIAEGKRIRPHFFGDLYALSDVTVDPRHWLVLQYHDVPEGDGMVLAFRRPNSPYTGFALNDLRGIDADAEYDVTLSHSYVPEPVARMRGAALREFTVEIPERPGSVLVEYHKQP
ncbi:MAG: NPCBM/NEW2 domain-containing protein [Candidatus Hydrogenedentes bacterium]|nr:NPCBM/NEW2 domain-containing protein [Candidatus Hydrogenedentota bacterium]